MAAYDATKIFRVGGQLCINPTNLATAFPHGGTALGGLGANGASLFPTFRTQTVTAEEYGNETVETVYMGESWILAANLRSWDDDVLTTIFRNTATGGSSSTKYLKAGDSSSVRAGGILSSNTVKLLFSPRDIATHPAALLYKAVPLVEESARLRLSALSELVFPVVFRAMRDSNGEVMQLGLLDDLSVNSS